MPDREKVIDGLDEIRHYNCEQMFYNDIFIRGIADDAMNMLKEQEEEIQNLRRENHNILTQFHEWAKEQEAVEPKSHPAKAWTRAKTLWFCGACGARISKRKTKFCQECGRSVKWE